MDDQLKRQAIREAGQAIFVWLAFMLLTILLNGTILFLLGQDLSAWTYSSAKSVLSSFVVYGVMFLLVPLVMVKGWETVRQPGFLLPLLLAIAAVSLWNILRGVAVIAIIVLAYLHWRYDLSGLGIRSSDWRKDALAALLVGLLIAIPTLFSPTGSHVYLGSALQVGLFRLLGNPASSVENLFYFGFLAERLSKLTGRLWTPLLIGLMYMMHEMTNPEYWYEGMQFVLVFVGVAIIASIYLWRRSVLPIWLGDGLGRFLGSLFG